MSNWQFGVLVLLLGGQFLWLYTSVRFVAEPGATNTNTVQGGNTVSIGNTRNDDMREKAAALGYYTPSMAAEILELSISEVTDRCRKGIIPGEKVGHRWQIPTSYIEAVKRD